MRRLLAAALVAVLAVSAVLLALPLSSAAPSNAPAAVRPSAGLSVTSTDQYGGATTEYWTGYSNGQVFFYVVDINGDATGTVQINDLNATRDGLTNPTATFHVGLAAGFNDSTTWGGHYLIPFSLVYGGTWNITFQTTLGGFTYQNFTVHTYDVSVGTIQPAVLPGHTFGVTWIVTSSVNDSLLTTPLTSYTLLAVFFNGASYGKVPGTPANLPTTPLGNFTITAPSTAVGTIFLAIWANYTAGSNNQSEAGFDEIGAATLNAPTLCLGASPMTLNCFGSSTFNNGSSIFAVADVTMSTTSPYFATFPAPGLNVKFVTENNGIVVTTPGSPPSTVVTNATGVAGIIFPGSIPPYSSTNPNQVVVTVTDPQNPLITVPPTTATFNLATSLTPFPRLYLSLDSTQYYGGDTVTASWQIWGQNATVTSGWMAGWWQAYSYATSTYLAQGTIASTGLTGQFQFVLPTNTNGAFIVYFVAHNASASDSYDAIATVTPPTILLSPSETTYLPGDSVTVTVTPEGSVLSGATLYEVVSDNTGVTWSSGVLTGNQVQLTIPSAGAPTAVYVSVAAQTSTSGLIAQAATTLREASGYVMTAGIATASSYLDGSYQPGQTIDISYAISARGMTTLSKSFTVTVTPLGGTFGNQAWTVQTSSPTGTVPVTIPSGAPAGTILFYVSGVANNCFGSCSAYGVVSITVNPNPAVPSYQVVPNSGVTVGWIILLILIVLVAAMLFMMLRRRNRPMVMKADSSGSSSSPPPSAWKESPPASSPPSGGSGGSQPPLPGSGGGPPPK